MNSYLHSNSKSIVDIVVVEITDVSLEEYHYCWNFAVTVAVAADVYVDVVVAVVVIEDMLPSVGAE